MTESVRYPLGRIVNHDPRSLNFPFRLATPIQTTNHVFLGPVLNQGDIGSCTGNAMSQVLNTETLKGNERGLLTEVDAISLYTRATELDDFQGTYPGEDTGSSGLAVAKAAKEKGYISSYTHAFTFDMMLSALTVSPVIIGINWYDKMFTPNAKNFLTPTGSIAGGHEIAVIGLDVKRKFVTLLNSWGEGWGDNGRAYLSFYSLRRLLKQQGDVIVPSLT